MIVAERERIMSGENQETSLGTASTEKGVKYFSLAPGTAKFSGPQGEMSEVTGVIESQTTVGVLNERRDGPRYSAYVQEAAKTVIEDSINTNNTKQDRYWVGKIRGQKGFLRA